MQCRRASWTLRSEVNSERAAGRARPVTPFMSLASPPVIRQSTSSSPSRWVPWIGLVLGLLFSCRGNDEPREAQLVDTTAALSSSVGPNARSLPHEGRLSAFRPHFERCANAFGVHVIATDTVEDAKLEHAATVLAEWIDNDEDGVPDDPRVHRALIEGGAFLVMAGTEGEMEEVFDELDFESLEDAGFWIGQDLYGEETLPQGPPHVQRSGRFDATLEEVLHLVSNGWVLAYPGDLGYAPGSRLTNAMDLARGGRFERIPAEYPEGAWYHYDDRTCDYECMAAEYLYWALTTYLGGQSYPGRAAEIAHEWECATPAQLVERDPQVVELLNDPALALPRVLPNGDYRPWSTGNR